MTTRQRQAVLAKVAEIKAQLLVDKRKLSKLGRLVKEMKVNDFVSYLSFHNDEAYLVLNFSLYEWAFVNADSTPNDEEGGESEDDNESGQLSCESD